MPRRCATTARLRNALLGVDMMAPRPLLVLDRVRKVYTRGRLVRRPTFTLEADLAIDDPAIVGVVGPERRRQDHAVRDDDRLQRADRGPRLCRRHRHPSGQVSRARPAGDPLSPVLSGAPLPQAGAVRVPARRRRPRDPMVHLFDEPQFNPQDGYIGFMLDFFRKLRAEGRLVFLCLHPTATCHLEILAEIAEHFLLVAGRRRDAAAGFPDAGRRPAVAHLSRPGDDPRRRSAQLSTSLSNPSPFSARGKPL